MISCSSASARPGVETLADDAGHVDRSGLGQRRVRAGEREQAVDETGQPGDLCERRLEVGASLRGDVPLDVLEPEPKGRERRPELV